MKTGTKLLWGAIGILLFQSGCKESEIVGPGGSGKQVTVSGTVVQKNGGAAIDGAVVKNIAPSGGAPDTTKNGGTFKLPTFSITGRTLVSLVAHLSGLKDDSTSFYLDVTSADTSVVLRLDTLAKTTVTTLTSGKPSSIFVSSIEATNIAIRGTGLKENTTIVFEVRDSVGNPIVGTNVPVVKFSLLGGPHGGEYLYPTQAQTNPATGRAVTTLASGTKAGIVQVGATTSNDSIRSSNVTITISGGLPHSGHFSLSREKANIAGGLYDNLKAHFSVVIGDRYGNPTQPTQVYFTTTGGIISAKATTDESGFASAELTTTNPRPGIAIITATTIGDTTGNRADSIISQSIPIVFSRATQILLPQAGFTVPDSGSFPFNYQVQDVNGNPLVAGTTIKLSLTGPGAPDLELQGTTDYTMPDVDDTTYTNFKATIVDHTRGGIGGLFNVVVDVKSQNGNLTQSVVGVAIGGVGGGGVGGTSGIPQYINPVGSTRSSLAVNEGGDVSSSSTTVSFEVTDSAGNRLGPNAFDPTGSVKVVFSAVHFSGGVAGTFSTSLDSTDSRGLVNAHFTAGNRSGIVRIFATVASNPNVKGFFDVVIFGGYPDSNHVAVQMDRLNIPPGGTSTVAMQMADQFGNPSKPTHVYFTTEGGSIQPTGVSDEAGKLSVTLLGGPPVPTNPSAGRGFVTASLFGKDSIRIQKRIPFLFSGTPNILMPASGFQIPDSGSYVFSFKVQDINGNPMAAGTNVSIEAKGAGAQDLTITPSSFTTTDTRDTAAARYTAIVSDGKMGGASGQVTLTVSVSGLNGTASTSVSGTQISTASTGGSGGVPGYAASISLVSVSKSTVSVRGTGAGESSTLVWVLKDSVGNPITLSTADTVTFAINGGPGGGEFLTPTSAITDATGRVTTTFSAGTKSGVVQISATATIGTRTLSSSPVSITIFGGLPDSSAVTVSTNKLNYFAEEPAAIGSVSVQLGDRYNNPVQPGTAVYFTTSGGLISAAGSTDNDGHTGATLFGGNPLPAGGLDTITVRTVASSGASIIKRAYVTFSRATKILAPANGFVIPDSGEYTFSYQVQDQNGNPLVGGTTIQLSVSGQGSADLEFANAQSVTLPDTRDTNYTNFSAKLRDKTLGGVGGEVIVTISVTSANGAATYAFTGLLQSTSGGGGVGPGGTGPASKIDLFATSADPTRKISIAGAASDDNAQVFFVVKDSLGNPVDQAHKDTVTFLVLNGPGGGEFVSPSTGITDNIGRVSTTLKAGSKAGFVQVVGRITKGLTVIQSSPVTFSVAGGFPDSNAISIFVKDGGGSVRLNLPGLSTAGVIGRVSVSLADKFSNPVQEGTTVGFRTTGGYIESIGRTGSDGTVAVSLYGGNPNPPGGNDTIVIETVGENAVILRKKTVLTFSGPPIITTTNVPASDTVTVFDGGFTDVTYKVADGNGNPLSFGNTISVTVSGSAASEISTSSDNFVTTIDSRNPSDANFKVRLTDNLPSSGSSGIFQVTISATGPNGTATRRFYGRLNGPSTINPPSPSAKNPAQIAFLGVSNTDISVSGTGSNENTVLTYEVRDSLGTPVDKDHRAIADFTLQFFPNSFVSAGSSPRLIPNRDSTDEQGKLRVSVVSGTTAGVVQVVATVSLGGGNQLRTSPVRINVNSGFADQRHFTIATPKFNFPGLQKAFVTQDFTVQVADKYSNPVLAGTTVYFHTSHGTVQTTSAVTDANGFVTKTLYSANPFPTGSDSLPTGQGWGRVFAQTFGDSGVQITDSVQILWTGRPVIDTVGGSTPHAFGTLGLGASAGPWAFSVKDYLGHPMTSGTTISVTAPGATVNGDQNVTVADYTSGGAGVTDFSVYIVNPNSSATKTNPLSVVITVTHPTYGTFTRTLATGSLAVP